MTPDHLVSMANQIGRFYEAWPNRDEALDNAAAHLRRFWDPRMRRTLRDHLEGGGAGLEPFMAEAVTTHRESWTAGI